MASFFTRQFYIFWQAKLVFSYAIFYFAFASTPCCIIAESFYSYGRTYFPIDKLRRLNRASVMSMVPTRHEWHTNSINYHVGLQQGEAGLSIAVLYLCELLLKIPLRQQSRQVGFSNQSFDRDPLTIKTHKVMWVWAAWSIKIDLILALITVLFPTHLCQKQALTGC